MRAGIRRRRTRTQSGPSRPLWFCRSGIPMDSATIRCAPSSTAWEFRRCGSPCPTTTFAGRRSWSAPTTTSAPTSAGRSRPAARRWSISAAASTGLRSRATSTLACWEPASAPATPFWPATHDPRIRVNAFNHASTAFGDVTWAGQSTRHVRQALEEAGLTQDRVRALVGGRQPLLLLRQNRQPRSRRTAEASADGLCRLRPDLPKGVLAPGGRGLPAHRPQL